MGMRSFSRVFAGAALVASLFGASPVAARAFVIDSHAEYLSTCSFGGSGCDAISTVIGDIFVYSNGAISVGNTISGLNGYTDWYAPGALSDGSYQAVAVRTNLLGLSGYFDGVAINFYAAGTTVQLPDAFGDPGTMPLMQIQIGNWDQATDEYGSYNHLGTQVAFAYSGSPASGATIGYHVRGDANSNCTSIDDAYECGPELNWQQTAVSNGALNVGLSNFVFNIADEVDDFGQPAHRLNGSSVFDPHFDAVASPQPEPATWATLVLGFGVIGGALRRRATVKAVA